MKALLITSLLLLASCSSVTRPTYDYASLKYDSSSREVVNEAYAQLDNFKVEVCKGKGGDDCVEKFLQMVHARLANKYNAVPKKAMDTTCATYPVECQSHGFLEYMYITLHNRNVDLFAEYNDKWGEDDLQTEWRRFVRRVHDDSPAPQVQTVEHYHRSAPMYQQPVYQNPNVLPPAYRAPTHYQTNCQTYSWGTQCDTNGR